MVVELKVKAFEPEFAGKLNFYVNAVNDLIRTKDDNPTIGLLIFRDMEKRKYSGLCKALQPLLELRHIAM